MKKQNCNSIVRRNSWNGCWLWHWNFTASKNITKTVTVFVDSQEAVLMSAIKDGFENAGSRVETKIDNNFEKIKSRKGEPINIVIDPSTNAVISNADTSQVITVQKEKGFFKRLFNKNKD